MKHIKLFESWGEDQEGHPKWKGMASKNFVSVPEDEESLIFKKDGVSYQIKFPMFQGGSLDEIETYISNLGGGWRLPTIDECEYLDKLIQEEGSEWEYDYVIDEYELYWSSEKAFDEDEYGDEIDPSRYTWDFRKHSYKIVNPEYNVHPRFFCIKQI